MNIFISIIATGFVISVILFGLMSWANVRKWRSWLTLEMYWDRYPNCHTDNGTKCFNCGSRNIHMLGWNPKAKSQNQNQKIHRCMQCNTFLYRTGTHDFW